MGKQPGAGNTTDGLAFNGHEARFVPSGGTITSFTETLPTPLPARRFHIICEFP